MGVKLSSLFIDWMEESVYNNELLTLISTDTIT